MEQLQDNYHTDTIQYADFWQRAIAFIFDSIIIGIFNSVVINPVLVIAHIQLPDPVDFNTLQERINEAVKVNPNISFSEMFTVMGYTSDFIIVLFIYAVVKWLYYAQMEASPLQGTIGKMMMGIKVTDMDGNRLSFIKASGRHLAKFISDFTLGIGYFMAGFTEKKQALHDRLSGCLVVKK